MVPYILWFNYDLEKEEDNAISANYLSGYLLDKIGLPLSGYQTWLLGLREEYPVITANFAQTEQQMISLSTNGKSSPLTRRCTITISCNTII